LAVASKQTAGLIETYYKLLSKGKIMKTKYNSICPQCGLIIGHNADEGFVAYCDTNCFDHSKSTPPQRGVKASVKRFIKAVKANPTLRTKPIVGVKF